eukprot:Skav221793  [mRNA]  locus=scaffold4067:167442:169566:+ [translate_table: standard]
MLLWHSRMIDRCGPGRNDYDCTFWVGSRQLEPTLSFNPPHGLHVHILAEPRRSSPVHLQVPENIPLNYDTDLTENEDTDGSSFLQTSRVLDLRDVFRIFERLDTHLFLPKYDLNESVTPTFERQLWVQSWWMPGAPADEIVVYYDGSFCPKDDTAGIGVAAWIRQGAEWAFAGAISTALGPGSSSYLAEQLASLVAAKFAYDLVKLCALAGPVPQLAFCFDNMAVGMQLTGHWRAVHSKMTNHAIRNVLHLIAARFGIQPDAHHVRSHCGEPGNEIVDALAEEARLGRALHDLQEFLHDFVLPDHVRILDWVWTLFDATYPVAATAWHTDVSTHAANLNRHLQQRLAACPKLQRARPHKPSLTAFTWDLIQQKK